MIIASRIPAGPSDHPIAVAAVGEYLKAAGHEKEQGGALFRPLRNRTSAAGTQAALTGDSLWRIVMGYAEEVGIDVANFGPHSLRSTSATNALEHGTDIAAVSEWLAARKHDQTQEGVTASICGPSFPDEENI